MPQRKHTSKDMARDRLKLLLLAERVECSPQTMLMIKNDILQAVSKYFSVEEEQLKFHFTTFPDSLEIHIPLKTEGEREN